MSVNRSSRDELALLGGVPLCRFSEFPRDRVVPSAEALAAAASALSSGSWSMFTSPEVAAFETEFGYFVGAKHVVLVNSCTTAILASLMAAGVRAGDFVAVPAYTYIGSCMPILALGARPILVDIDLATQSMHVGALQRVLKAYPVRAVLHVHLFGACVSAAEISDLCRQHGASYIADSAQFLGDRGATSLLAELGAVCFSFGESKLLRLGEGGAIATNSAELAERLRMARHEGEQWTRLNSSRLAGKRPTTSDVLAHLASVQQGLNFRPLSISAAIGRVMLRELPDHLRVTAANAATLSDALAGMTNIALPSEQRRTWWTYPLRLVDEDVDRDSVLAALLAEGVPAGVHFPRLLVDHPIVKQSDAVEPEEPIAARQFARAHLVLPIYDPLQAEHMQRLSMALTKVLGNVDRLRSSAARTRAHHLLTALPIEELCDGLFLFLAEEHECWTPIRTPACLQ